MSKSLPDRPNLDRLKNEAKALLRAQKRGDRSVCEILGRIARLASASDDEILAARISLQEAQHAVAVEYGFESWKELKDRVTGQSAFAARVQEALDAFTCKGPDRDSTRSPWEERREAATRKLLDAGDEGFGVMVKLARSDNGRARNAAAIFFGLSDDTRAPEQLQALLEDDAVMVRSRALRFYAARIHPKCGRGDVWGIDEPADAVPQGIEAILPLVTDKNPKLRMDAVRALSAYAKLQHKGVEAALHSALDDAKHQVRHAAAQALNVPCLGCGRTWEVGE